MRLCCTACLALVASGCFLSHELSDESPGDVVCTPRCAGDPGDQVHFQTLPSNNAPVFWQLTDTCIDVTYDPALPGEHQLNLSANVDQFSSIPCSNLCLGFPRAAEAPDVTRVLDSLAERRIHIGLADGLGSSLVTLFHDRCSGALQNVLIDLDPDLIDEVEYQDFTLLVARALGLFRADRDVDSALAGRDVPTMADVAALCAMYGPDPFCE